MINEANEPSSACRLWRLSQVETSAPPVSRADYPGEPAKGQGRGESVVTGTGRSGKSALVTTATPKVTLVPMSVNHGQKTSPPNVLIHQSFVAGMFAGQ